MSEEIITGSAEENKDEELQEENKSEQLSDGGEKIKKEKRGGKGTFALGLAIILLALVGAGFLISVGIGQIKNHTGDSKEKAEYEDYLYPVATLDINTFDDVTGADMKDLICSSILSLLDDSDNSPYDFEFVEGEVSGMGIPQKTVEKAFKELFGTEVKPIHQSVECSTCIFTYQSQAKRYVIPVTGYDPAYIPKVLEINKTGEGAVELLAGYVSFGDWEKSEDGEFTSPEPAKYRKITLRKADKGYYISAIQNADAPDKK